MTSLRKLLVIAILVAWGSQFLYAIEPEWELIKEQDGIRIYRRDVPGTEIDEFKGDIIVRARIDVIGIVLQDVLAYPTWMEDCKHTQFIEKFDDRNFIVYQVQDTPWPVKNRDIVVRVTTTINWEAGSFTVIVKAIEDARIPPQEHLVRITELTGKWEVEYLDREHTKVTYSLNTDPAGSLPVSLISKNLQNAPYITLQGLQRIVKEPSYIDAANQSQDKKILERYIRLGYLTDK